MLKCFTKHDKKLSICMITILQLHVRLNIKQLVETQNLTPKQMLQRLPMALAQVNAGNTSKKLLNKIRRIIYPFYQAKKITKKFITNVMNSIKL